MSSERLQRVRLLLAAALDLPPERRHAYLEQQASDDPAVLAEVEDLLDLNESAGDFLSNSLPELLGARAREPRTLRAGAVVGHRYRVVRKLAESGFATVYLGEDTTLANKRVVLKVLDQSDSHALRKAFESELLSLSKLHHPNIVGVSDAGTLDNGTLFLVLAYVPGLTLREVLRSGPLQAERARSVVKGIGQALAAAHNAGVWHLDIKPENIILSEAGTPEERITVIDFGIARFKGLPGSVLAAASPAYMAPEQHDHPSARSDIYSLGRVAFEVFSGQLPETGVPVPSQLPRRVGSRAARAIARALDPDPAKRFATVSEFQNEVLAGRSANSRRTLATAAAVLLAAVILVASLKRNDEASEQAYSQPVPFVSAAGSEYRPAFAPDGSWLAFAAGRADRLDIYKTASNGEVIRLTDHPASDDQPEVSPDGKSLAFIRILPSDYAVMIKRLDPEGKEIEIARAREISSVSWAADSSALAVALQDGQAGGTNVRSINLKTLAWEDISSPPAGALGDDDPQVSPDGKRLAFVRKWTQAEADLCIMDIGPDLRPRSAPRQITFARDRIDSLQWTPDGRDILYLAGPLGRGALLRISAAGGKAVPALPGVTRVEGIAIPRHAWKLALSVYFSDSNIWRYDLQRSLAADALTQLIAGSYDDEEAHLSPDGTRIAFGSSRSGTEQIWLADANGRHARRITSFASPDAMGVLWSRDSKDLIVSVRSREQGERVYRTPAAGAPQLTEILDSAMATSLSHDGARLYVVKRSGVERQVWQYRYPEMTSPQRIIAGEARVAMESPDGRFLYFTRRTEKEGLWRQRLPAGVPERLAERIYRRNLFAPGRNGIYYIAPQTDGTPALHFRAERNGQASMLRAFDNDIFWGLDLAADERSLLFSQFDVENSDIMLVENFR